MMSINDFVLNLTPLESILYEIAYTKHSEQISIDNVNVIVIKDILISLEINMSFLSSSRIHAISCFQRSSFNI